MPIISDEYANQMVDLLEAGKLNERQAANANALLDTWKWSKLNVDYSPAEFRDTRAGTTIRSGGEVIQVAPEPIENLPPEHKLRRQKAAADEGIDLYEGAVHFGARVKMAASLQDDATQTALLTQAVKDSGIANPANLPPGVPLVRKDENTGEMVYLRQLENGKYRWSMVDSLGLDFGDFADMARPDEIGALIGGIAGAVYGGAPGEIAAATAGRQVGVGVQAWLTKQFGVEGDVAEKWLGEMKAAFGDSAVEAAFTSGGAGLVRMARATGRWADMTATGRSGLHGGQVVKTEEEIRQALKEAGDDVAVINEGVERGAGPRVVLTAGEATQDARRIEREQSYMKVATADTRNQNAQRTAENREALTSWVARHSYGADPYTAPAAVDGYRNLARRHNSQIARQLDGAGEPLTVDVLATPDGGQIRVYGYEGMQDVKNAPKITAFDSVRDGEQYRGIMTADAGDYPGTGGKLYRHIIEEAMDEGRIPTSDWAGVSEDAVNVWRSLEREGYTIEVTPDLPDARISDFIDKDNQLTELGEKYLQTGDMAAGRSFMRKTLDGQPVEQPVFTVRARPEESQQAFLASIDGEYQRALMEGDLATVADNFAGIEARAFQYKTDAEQLVGWNPQTQRGRYRVQNNLNGNSLGKVLGGLRMRVERSLSRGQASESDRVLADMFADEADFATLNDPLLDVAQVGRAIDYLDAAIANGAGEEVMMVRQALDSLTKNAKWIDTVDNAADTGPVRSKWVQTRGMYSVSRDLADEAGATLEANVLLQRDADGRFPASSIFALEKVLKNGAAPGSMDTVIRSNPEARGNMQQALLEIYRKRVTPGGKFNLTAHNKFIDEYSAAIDKSMEPGMANRMRGAPERMGAYVSNYEKRWRELKKGIVARMKGDPDLRKLGMNAFNHNNMWQSFRKMTPADRKYVRNALRGFGRQFGGDVYETLQKAALQDFGQKFNTFVNAGNWREMENILMKDKQAITELFGEGYYEGLQAVTRTLKRTEEGIAYVAPENQPLWLRLTRSVFGPLSRKQRIATAATFTHKRVVARNTLRILESPEDFAKFRMYTAPGGKMDRAAVAGLVRLGLFDGIPLSEDPETRLEEVQAIMLDIERATTPLETAPAPRKTGRNETRRSGMNAPERGTGGTPPVTFDTPEVSDTPMPQYNPDATPRAERPVNTNPGLPVSQGREAAIKAYDADFEAGEQFRKF